MIWTGERNRAQGQLVAEMYRAAAPVPCERVAVIAGGLPGADKAAPLAEAGVDRSRYLTVSIDAVLARMATAQLIPESDGLSPLARSGLVHGEAQYLAKRVGLLALMDGRNLILDISLASWRAAEAWTYALRFADYAVHAVFADIGIADAVADPRRPTAAARKNTGGDRATAAGASRRGHPGAGHAGRGRAQESHQVGRWRAIGRRDRRNRGDGNLSRQRGGRHATSYREGRLSLDDLTLEFRVRRWPQVPDVCPPELDQARAAIDDPEPYVPGSFDDVVLAYDLGWLADADYDILATAAVGLPEG